MNKITVVCFAFVANIAIGVEPEREMAFGVSREGGFTRVSENPRCQRRRERYLRMRSSEGTEGQVCSVAICDPDTRSTQLQKLLEVREELLPIEGARAVMANTYQDCSVLAPDNILCLGNELGADQNVEVSRDSDGLIRRTVTGLGVPHEYYQERCAEKSKMNRASNCREPCIRPIVFNMGAKPSFARGEGGSWVLDVNRTHSGRNRYRESAGSSTVPANVGLDCSGFQSASLLSKSLLMMPLGGLKELEKPIGIRLAQVHHFAPTQFKTAGDDPRTCFASVVLEKNRPISPGDIIATDTHVMMVDQIDAGWKNDPFGMGCWSEKPNLDVEGNCSDRKVKEEDLKRVDCDLASPEYFRFDIIHSAGADNKGVMRNAAFDLFSKYCPVARVNGECPVALEGGADIVTGNLLKNFARSYCLAYKKGGRFPKARSPEIGIVRHLGARKKGCNLPHPTKLKNADCLDCVPPYFVENRD